MIAPLSLLLAAGWLTNVPTAVIMYYALGFLVVWLAFLRRSRAIVASASIAIILSGALAAFYLVPVFHQQHWVNIGQVLASGVRPADNFLFTVTSDADHNQFNRVASVVAVWELLLVAPLVFFSRGGPARMLWQAMLALDLLCTLLMMKFTLPLWMHLPELRYVQFPWRWLLCLSVVFALGIVMAARQWWLRTIVFLVALGSVVYVWQRVLPPWWDTSADIQEMVDNQQDAIGNEGTDEYVPVGADPYDVDQKAPRVRFEGSGTAQIQIEKWLSEKRVVSANATSPGKLVLRLFNYPLWKVEVNGHAVQTESTPHTGQMIVPVARGDNRILITFAEGWDRRLGAAISACALGLAILVFIKSRRRGLIADD